ncbi:zinc finger MYM-type protein 1-like protein [Tanacetum coccineum]
MGKLITIDLYFKRKSSNTVENATQENKRSKASTSDNFQPQNQIEEHIYEFPKLNSEEVDLNSLERDPGKRKRMCEYPANKKEEVRLAYLNKGPFNSFENVSSKVNQRSVPVDSNTHGSVSFLIAFWQNLVESQEVTPFGTIREQSAETIIKNRMRLKASIDIVRWLTFQICSFRGRDETLNSINRGNFIELLKLLASYNVEVANVVLENAPYNAKYTSGLIQKEILRIIANNVRKHIRKEVGDSYFCIMVDEARDESKEEQMDIVLRFVDKDGFIRERFLDIVHVYDTMAGWNGLQALVAKDCPYAYYVHYFAHRLQLAFSKEVIPVHQFFTKLTSVVNVICASSKRHDELQKAKSIEIQHLLELGEIKTGKGANQIGTLRRAGDTRWGSHFNSVCSLFRMFNPTRSVLESIIEDGSCASQRGEADAAYTYLKSFEFIFILHLMKEVMGRTDILNQALQKKKQDIGNAVELVSATKKSLNEFRNNGWDTFLQQVIFFCEKYQIDVPDMEAPYKSTRYRPRRQDNHVSFEHFYRVDVFLCILDKQLHELNTRFSDEATGLLTLSSALVPKRGTKTFDISKICHLVERYYPADISAEKSLVKTQKRETYYLFDRLIRLILTLPVSTATTERAFSAMKVCKNRLRNKMSDDFLADSLVVYIEKEIAEKIDSQSVIEEFKSVGEVGSGYRHGLPCGVAVEREGSSMLRRTQEGQRVHSLQPLHLSCLQPPP